MCEGLGIMRWADGTSYEGEWRQGLMQGTGIEVYTDGGVYSGQFHGNSRHGIGLYAFADGQAFAGQFNFGLQHGQGILTAADGATEIFAIFDQGRLTDKFAASEGNSGAMRRDMDNVLHKAERVTQRAQLRAAAMQPLAELAGDPSVPRDFSGDLSGLLPRGAALRDRLSEAPAPRRE